MVCDVKAPGIPTTYFFSYSLDQKIWTSAPESTRSRITITGLTPGQTYAFRYRTFNHKGMSDFSQFITFIVK